MSLYLQLFVGGLTSLFTLFVFVCIKWCRTHIVLCFYFVFLRLCCQFLWIVHFFIAPSVFSNIYFNTITFTERKYLCWKLKQDVPSKYLTALSIFSKCTSTSLFTGSVILCIKIWTFSWISYIILFKIRGYQIPY